MPSVELGIFDHLVFLVLAVFLSFEGRRRYRALLAGIDAGRADARVREYRNVLMEEWLLTAVVAGGWLVLSRGPATIGLMPRNTTPTLVGYGVTVLIIVILLLESRLIFGSEKKRQKVRKSIASAVAFLPVNHQEKTLFGFVAITAGICEEFLYRGFLLTYLTGWLPGQPTWLIIVLGGAFFGFAHLYQGAVGVLKTGVVGVLLGGLYWLTGSLWAPMLLHTAIDLNSGWVGWRVMQDDVNGDESVSGAA